MMERAVQSAIRPRISMKNYHVTPNGETWNLAEENGTLLSSYRTKEEAVSGARAFVSARSGSLKIHKADGTIEEERTYPRSCEESGMKTFDLKPEVNHWVLADESGRKVSSYANKHDALRGAAKRVAKEFGALVVRRVDGSIEEERRYPPANTFTLSTA